MTDEEIFEGLFRAHYGDLLAYAVRRCPTRQDAEDVVAETFAVAWRRLHELPPGDRKRLWLFGTARLVRLNHGRHRRRRDGLLARIRSLTPSTAHPDPTDEAHHREHVRQALERLPERDREVLQLQVWEGLTGDEIAEVLEISPAAVWKRLQRARDRLADLLDNDAQSSITLTTAPGKATR